MAANPLSAVPTPPLPPWARHPWWWLFQGTIWFGAFCFLTGAAFGLFVLGYRLVVHVAR